MLLSLMQPILSPVHAVQALEARDQLQSAFKVLSAPLLWSRDSRSYPKKLSAIMNAWQFLSLLTQVRRWCQVHETIHDVTFLHNELFYAAAQKKYVYIYDHRGIEVHCLKVSPRDALCYALTDSMPVLSLLHCDRVQ